MQQKDTIAKCVSNRSRLEGAVDNSFFSLEIYIINYEILEKKYRSVGDVAFVVTVSLEQKRTVHLANNNNNNNVSSKIISLFDPLSLFVRMNMNISCLGDVQIGVMRYDDGDSCR